MDNQINFTKKAQVVVQDAKAYEEMVELLTTIKKVNTAAAAFDKGESHPIKEALNEIEQIVEYIALDSVPNALNWYSNLKTKIQNLESLPERCPLTDESPSFSFEVHCLLG